MSIINKIINKMKEQYKLVWLFYKIKYSEYLSKDKLENQKLLKLKRILKIAVETVPYYLNLKEKIDFDNFTIAELQKFPIINKNIMRSNPELFKSTKYKKKGIIQHTSGSSGLPFEFLSYPDNEIIDQAFAMRAWGMGNYNYKIKDPIIMLRSYAPKDCEQLYKIDKINNFWYLSAYHINNSNLQKYVETIKQSKAKILRGYPSSIYIFTQLLKENNIKLDQIKTIVTSSETLLQKYREEIENYWKIKVLDWYGQNEKTVTVQQCKFGNYHNNDEYGIVEINSENHIIATSLNNYVMPFIRYDTEDIAIPCSSFEKCDCGRKLSVPFLGISGRSDDILFKNDGTKIPTINIYTAMHSFEKIKQFKITQQEDKSLAVQLCFNQKIAADYLEDIKKELIKRTGDLIIKFELVSEIKRDKSTGKIKTIESKIKK